MSNSDSFFKIISCKVKAEKLLKMAEKRDFYLKKCEKNLVNKKARKGCIYKAETVCIKETKYLLKKLKKIYKHIHISLKKDLKRVKIIKLKSSAEKGMPHTRPYNIICYSDIKDFTSETILHELWHIHQRKYKTLWDSVFYDLGWEKWKGNLPLSLEKKRRYNPDTIDSPFYVYKKRFVSIPVFKNSLNPKVNSVKIIFYDIQKNQNIFNIPKCLVGKFPNLPLEGYEHPREILAYKLSKIF